MPPSQRTAETVLVQSCATCGMVLDDAGEFHPHLFCLLKQAGRDPWADFKWAVEQLGLEMPDKPPLVRALSRTLDAHDDLVEAQLLERLERDSLLKDGLTPTGVRSHLDG